MNDAKSQIIRNFIATSLGVILIAFLIQLVAPDFFTKKNSNPLDVKSRSNLKDEDLKAIVTTMRLRHPADDSGREELTARNLLKLGSQLFFDEELSANGQVSCGTCHQPHASFTDNKTVAVGLAATNKNTPTIINSYAGQWFFWNGRSDSLESQALGPIENNKEHGFSRSKIAAIILKKYKNIYEDVFGKIPEEISNIQFLSEQPPPASLYWNDAKSKSMLISSAVAAYALATIQSESLVKEILKEAQSQGIQPVEIVKSKSSGISTIIQPAIQNPNSFEALSVEQQKSINKIFANFGRAIAAFERTIRTQDSPFDKFVDRLLQASALNSTSDKSTPFLSNSPAMALGEKFGESELNGLRLFTGKGNCTLCHQGPYFTDQQFHNIGLMPLNDHELDLGRAQGLLNARADTFNCLGEFLTSPNPQSPSESCLELPFLESESSEAVGAFKTPTLRNLSDTAPYGHDGRFPKLENILLHYNQLGVKPAVGHTEESLLPLNFTTTELKDLEAFLLSLNSDVTFYKEDQP